MSVDKEPSIPEDVLEALDYSSTEDVALDMILLEAKAKISEFREEVKRFRERYDMKFDEFREKLESKQEQEDFEEEDDYMAWKFARESLQYWEERVDLLEDAA